MTITIDTLLLSVIAVLLGVQLVLLRSYKNSQAGQLADIVGLLNLEIDRLYRVFITNKGAYLAMLYEGQLSDKQYKQLLKQCVEFILTSMPKGVMKLVLTRYLTKSQLIEYITMVVDQKASRDILARATSTMVMSK